MNTRLVRRRGMGHSRRSTMATLATQQAAVADLSLLALGDAALERVLTAAVTIVAEMLEVEVAAHLEMVPGGELLCLRAGVGVSPTMIGATASAADSESLVEGVLERGNAVRVAEAGGGGRYVVLFGVDVGAMTGLAVRIPGQQGRDGVLVALTDLSRAFSDDDVGFLQAIANVVGAAIDRNEAAEELRRREREFKVVVEHSADTIVRLDNQLHFVYVNPAAEQVMGFPASALLGKTNRFLPVADSLIDQWDLALHRALRTGEEESFESMYPSPGGDRYFDVRVWPELGPDGSVEFLLVVGRDITASKQREFERTRIYEELLARDTRLHELLERTLLNQQDPTRRRPQSLALADQFTTRERQILRLLARGLTNRRIGQEIGLSPSTVKNYIASILPRLNATDRTHAAVLAAGLGLIDDES